MDIQFFSNQFESTPVLSSHRLPCIHSYSTLIHSFFLLLSFHSSSRDLFISFFYHFIHKNGTWDLVPLPKGRKALPCKWVYKYKYTSDSALPKYKARIVAKSFKQE